MKSPTRGVGEDMEPGLAGAGGQYQAKRRPT
jgi:hypothetical protein